MTPTGTAMVTLPTDEQILITREFDAPKHLVYKAYTTPELVRRWWAGKRGEVTTCEIDLRVGGRWRYVMVASEGFEADAPVNTVTFTEADGRTTLTLLTDTGSKEVRDAIIDSGMEGGMQEGMDLLEEVAISLR